MFPRVLMPFVATLFDSPELLNLFNYAICHIVFKMVAYYGVGIAKSDFIGDELTVLVVKVNKIRGCKENL